MPTRSPMHQQIYTLPALVRETAQPFDAAARKALDFATCTSVKRIYLVGCGDSHHAPVGAELAFHQLAGVPTQAISSLPFSRYTAGYLPATGPKTNLVIGVSVSGKVSRTIEALDMARQAGAMTVALTGNPGGPLGKVADAVLETAVPALPSDLQVAVVPGVRSYLASQVALLMAALRIGEVRGQYSTREADAERAVIQSLAETIEATIDSCQPVVDQLVDDWRDAPMFEFVGAGPLYGVAMFSAAKLLEATGEAALAQETEEWSHLQYFVSEPNIPIMLLCANGFDADRMAEVARAAKRIGRPLALAGQAATGEIAQHVDALLPVPADVPERYAALVYSIPGELFAASRAEALGTPYFCDFAGGRADEASAIYNSRQIAAPLR
ncbi:MAG: SIS domain-containing protein [Chloroflexi bacterium]|nr:SIS domain-containing protein [Chloroflexota bacterium]MCY4247069.1 SIS domain-containing protein [Chloroflexota bacterium]